MLAVPTWDAAIAAIGKPLGHDVRYKTHKHLDVRMSQAISDAWRGLYPTRWRANFDDSDALHRAERRYWGSNLGVLGHDLPQGHTIVLGWTTYDLYNFSDMAQDASQAGKRAPKVLAAAWEVAQSAGLWWAFENAVILTERPAEIHTNQEMLLHRAGGPAIVYRDGTKVYAWEGDRMREELVMHPETLRASELREFPPSFRAYAKDRVGTIGVQPKKKLKLSSILRAKLPTNAKARLAQLREHAGGALPFHLRYLAGEQEAVWSELIALGDSVREDPYAADALAVAYETMQRVAANVQIVIGRLNQLSYRFQTEVTMPDESAMLPHLPPGPVAQKRVQQLEKAARGSAPLSLRAFYEVVGAVDLNGHHPSLAPRDDEGGCEISPDPLAVIPLEVITSDTRPEALSGGRIPIAADEIFKAGGAGGDVYEIEVPDLGADGELLNTAYGDKLFFVEYLRLCFRWGGFPGWKHAVGARPPEIEQLRQGLVQF
jgi:hypothetical protein